MGIKMYKILLFSIMLIFLNCAYADPFDLNKMPNINPESANFRTVTFGDMHGNVKKICWSLLRVGAIKMSTEDYAEFVELYNNWIPNLHFDVAVAFPGFKIEHISEPIPGLSFKNLEEDKAKIAQNIQKFKSLLLKIEFPRNYKVRFLGDMLADRGKCDYLTLLFIEYIQKHLDLVIIESNHDVVLQNNILSNLEHEWMHFPYTFQNASMYGLKVLIDLDIVELEEVEGLMSSYNKHIKFIDYDLNNSKTKLIIFMHAPNDLSYLLRLVNILNYWLKSSHHINKDVRLLSKIIMDLDIFTDKNALMKTIDAINKLFAYLFFEQNLIIPENVIEFLNRRESPGMRHFDQDTIELLVHGHVGEMGYNYPSCLNLDSDIGKIDLKELNYFQELEFRYTPKKEITNNELGVLMLFTDPVVWQAELDLPNGPEDQWVNQEVLFGRENLPPKSPTLLNPNPLGWFV